MISNTEDTRVMAAKKLCHRGNKSYKKNIKNDEIIKQLF